MGIYKRQDSPWWWMVLVVPGARPRWQSTKIPIDAPSSAQRAELKKAAEALCAHEQAKLVLRRRGVVTELSTATIDEYLTWYEKHVTAGKRGAPREREILARLRTDLGREPLQGLTKERIVEWRTGRRKTVGAGTVNRELDVLKHALNQAVPTYLEASPIAGLQRLYTPAHEGAVLSAVQEGAVLKALPFADRVLVVAALDTLMRAGDLLRLQWAHDHGGYLTVLNPKTGASYKVPVSSRLRAALDQLPRKGAYVFWHRRHAKTERVRVNGLKQMFQRACAAAKVKYGRAGGLTFHGLRHTGATRMVHAGVDLRTVQAIGGWSSLRMLMRYVHPTGATERAAVEAVGQGVVCDLTRSISPVNGASAGKTVSVDIPCVSVVEEKSEGGAPMAAPIDESSRLQRKKGGGRREDRTRGLRVANDH